MHSLYFMKEKRTKRTFDNQQIKFPSLTHGCFVPCLVEICPMVLENKFFKVCNIFSLLGRDPFNIETNLNPFYQRMRCVKLWLK